VTGRQQRASGRRIIYGPEGGYALGVTSKNEQFIIPDDLIFDASTVSCEA
jgi:hypothetical protein